MSQRLRAKVGLYYPKSEYLEDVVKAGGCSRLTPAQRKRMYREVKAGDYCDDVSDTARDHWLKQGRIERVTVADPKPKPSLTRRSKKEDKGDG